MTDTLPTVDELQDPADDFEKLRRAAGEMLKPGPWRHVNPGFGRGSHCAKGCGANIGEHTDCPVPDPATGSIPEIAEQLMKKWRCDLNVFFAATRAYLRTKDDGERTAMELYEWWIFRAEPAERAALALAVMKKARVE